MLLTPPVSSFNVVADLCIFVRNKNGSVREINERLCCVSSPSEMLYCVRYTLIAEHIGIMIVYIIV